MLFLYLLDPVFLIDYAGKLSFSPKKSFRFLSGTNSKGKKKKLIESDTLASASEERTPLFLQIAKKSHSAWLSFSKAAKSSSYSQIRPRHFPQALQTAGFPARVALCSPTGIVCGVTSSHCTTLWSLGWRQSYFWAPAPAFPRWEAEIHALLRVRWARLRARRRQAERRRLPGRRAALSGSNNFWAAQNLARFGVVLLSWLMKYCNSHWFSKERGKHGMQGSKYGHSQTPSPVGIPPMHSGTSGSSQSAHLESPQRNRPNLKKQSKSRAFKPRGHWQQADSRLPSVSFPNCTSPRSMQKTNSLCFEGKKQLTGFQCSDKTITLTKQFSKFFFKLLTYGLPKSFLPSPRYCSDFLNGRTSRLFKQASWGAWKQNQTPVTVPRIKTALISFLLEDKLSMNVCFALKNREYGMYTTLLPGLKSSNKNWSKMLQKGGIIFATSPIFCTLPLLPSDLLNKLKRFAQPFSSFSALPAPALGIVWK